MNEEAAVESHHHQHHHDHSSQQSQMIDSIEKDRLDDVVVEEDENAPEIELKKKRESIGNQSDDSIENQPCGDDENEEDDAESRMKQEIIEERINTRGVKFVADSAIVGGTNPSLISSTNSNISSTSSMSKSSSLNNNNNNNTNSNPSQTSPSSQQPQQPIQQQQQSSANSQSSSPSLSVSPRIKSQTNSKSEKISPGLAKRVQAPEEEDNNQQEEQNNQNQEEENVEVVEEKHTKITTLAGSSNRRTMAPASKSASSKSANPAAAAAKIQNALEKNMQRLNLYRPNSQSAGHKQQHAANLSKEDIELFTNPDYDSSTIASSSSINGSNGNQEEDAEYSTTTTTSRSIKPTGTVGGPYYLGKIPEHKTVEQSSKTKGHYQQQQCQQVINRSSTDREMTPDSIDNDTPQHRVSTRPNTGSRLVSKRGVNTNTSTSRNIPNPKKTPINQRTQPQTQPQPQPQKPAQQKMGVGKVNGNRKIVIPDEEEEERYEESGAANSRCSKTVATAAAKKVPPPAAAAASVQQLDEEDELNNGVYIEEQDEDELDEDEYERYHRHHHHHHHHHDHEHYEDEEDDDDDEYLDEDAEQHDDYDDDYEDEQDHNHNAHNYNNQRHGYHHYPHDHDHHHAHHRQHQENNNNNTNKTNRSQYTKTNNFNNPIPKPIEPKTSGAVSSSSRTANNTNIRQDQVVSKTRRVSTESESSTSKASANANKAAAAAKQGGGKSEAMSRSATSGDCSARRPGGPVRRKSTTASDDREFIDTDEETNKLLDTARTVTEYHDEETDEDKARRNGQDKSAVAAKSSNPSTSSQDNDRNVDRQQKSKETQPPPPSTTHQIMDPDNQVLIEGVLFRARYLGSTQLVTDGNPTKLTRMLQAQEAVGRIKAPEGESQPSVEVDLFVSTEKIMVLNTDLQEIMMDHSLRSISYIADIGNLVVLMAKRRPPGGGQESGQAAAAAATSAPSKILCHVFESPEAQLVAQSIGQAFQVAYMEYLRANGIDDLTIMKDLDYQEVLNQQEIMGNELAMFAKKECQKEVLVPKQKNEPLGLVIVESGWGSMLPTVVVANMAPTGPAARCGALNIGDQIISCNGISMVGLPLSTCQTHVKNTRHLTLVRLVVVPCPPVVEVLIKRPDTKYQLGFSVQDGIICSLLRGGIAERGGVRVGHRIIEINGHSVVATTHDKIVNMLANSVGELRMKTMPTQMFRLLTGQELPVYI